jgi:hypothetical protein
MGQVEVGCRYRERGLGLTIGETIEIHLMRLFWIILGRWLTVGRSASRQGATDCKLASSTRVPERQILYAD